MEFKQTVVYSTNSQLLFAFRLPAAFPSALSTGSTKVSVWNSWINFTNSFELSGIDRSVFGNVISFTSTPLIVLSRLLIPGLSTVKLASAIAVLDIWYSDFKCFFKSSIREERIILRHEG